MTTRSWLSSFWREEPLARTRIRSVRENEATETNGIEIKIERGIEVATIEIVS